ncbi:hypothetical protein BCR44DRAFT_1522628 [Catenaria anguillulae PL171]|uniref:Uncharacterized protein n=1 Tax=Catenaria anguillulae PL171 TaxID=765915 RepID=A0A1Y2H677_9FUNG|nr:hypothetical protein BCR44DRAFT_1522628 [Catenaria anguillulae PL171]
MTPAPGGFRHRKAQEQQQQNQIRQQQENQRDHNRAIADAHKAEQRESRRRARSSEPRVTGPAHMPRIPSMNPQLASPTFKTKSTLMFNTCSRKRRRQVPRDMPVDSASVAESASSSTVKSDKGKKPRSSFLAAAMSAALAAMAPSKKKHKEDKHQDAAKKKGKPKMEFKIKFGSDATDPKHSLDKVKLDIGQLAETALMFKVKDKDGVEHEVPLQVPLSLASSKLKSKGKPASASTSDHEPASSSSSRSNSIPQSPVTTESEDSDGMASLTTPPDNRSLSHIQAKVRSSPSSPLSPISPARTTLQHTVSVPHVAQEQPDVGRSLTAESLEVARPRVVPRSSRCKIEFYPLSHTIGPGVSPDWSVGDQCTLLPTSFEDYHHGYMRATVPGRGDPSLLPLFSVSARTVHYSAAPFLPHSVPIVAHAMDQHTSTSLAGSRPPIFVCDSSMGIQMLNLPSSQWANEPISMNRLTLSAVSQTVRNPEITDLFQGWTGSSRFAMGYIPRTHSLYLVGGGRSAKHQMSVIDIESGWIGPADCPYPGWTNHTVIHVDGGLYAGSGGTSSRRFAHLDPREKQWNKLNKWDAVSNFNLRTQLVHDQHSQSIIKMAVGGNLRQVASSAELYDIRAAKWMALVERFPGLAGSGGEGVQYLGRSIVRNVGLSMMWLGDTSWLTPSWYPVMVIDAVSQVGGQESLALWDMVGDRCMRYDQVDSEGTTATPWRSAGAPVLCGHDPSAGYISIARSQADECMVRRIVLGPEVSMEV